MKRLVLLTTIMIVACSCAGSLNITQNGKSDYRIVVTADADSMTQLGARRLQQYLARISGAELPIITDDVSAAGPEIVLGVTNRSETKGYDIQPFGMDGFEIFARDKNLYILGGYPRGTFNGVYGLLDDYLGCRLYSSKVEIVPERPSIKLPAKIATKQIPVITYRNTHYTPTNDQKYIEWHRVSHDAKGGQPDWGHWVHTYNHFVPPAKYFASHPEYYALVRGNRQISQLCLSNPEVFDIVCEQLAKEIEENPQALYWSVSQNDNTEYCQCEECLKADAIDGGPTGSVLQFANKVAVRFPDKIVSTLAYQYSRAAPAVTKPAGNVNIMFCNIECYRNEPIASDSTSTSFRKDMEDWAKLTDNILVWDYVVQFTNLVSPFPNLHVLQPNIQYFVDNSVVAMFEQGNREVGGEFADLRAYLIAKLSWNPYLDMDSLMNDFCDGYYGAGGKHVRHYIDTITQNLKASGRYLGIFENPCMPADSYLSPENLILYHHIFYKAEAAVADNPGQLQRVKISRQPLYYAQIEQARADPHGPYGMFYIGDNGKSAVKPEFAEMFDNFIALCKEEGVTRLSEWHTTPDDYDKLLKNIMAMQVDGNIAFRKPYALSTQPNAPYDRNADKALTDGVFGTDDFQSAWLGWDVPTYEVTVDLGSVQPVSKFKTRFMQKFVSWMFLPLGVDYYVSSDGNTFAKVGSVDKAPDRNRDEFAENFQLNSKTDARYVRATVRGIGKCPDWHQGAGGPSYVFMDELTVE